MAPVTPIIEPVRATSGDTWLWTYSSADYPLTEGWTLSYAIRGLSAPAWDATWAVASSNTTTVTIPSAITVALAPGRYELTRIWTGSGTYAGRRDTEACAPLTVVADPAGAGPGDRQTFAEKGLAAVEAAITARLAGDEPSEYSIGDRSVKRMTLADLYAARARLRLEVWRERHPGQSAPSALVRFGAVA